MNTNMQKNSIEILSPAGSYESALAGINCGANAIYIGAKDFNARKNADNFTNEQFSEVVKYAHERGVKVYMTLNTVLYDDEIPTLLNTLRFACDVGVDALIIQDLAIYKLVKECCPAMPLHASTQMSVHTKNGALILREMGFERVVLAREMNEREIKEITSECDIQTEVFVHGALCMCVSGQCYMSAMIGQRSGNRGLCAQPCRLPFSSSDEKNRYDLSLKDLSLINEVKKLMDMGVTSLKIEGRMKRPEYVAAAVTALRGAVDFNKVSDELFRNLSNVFSRSGFTSGYFNFKLGKDMFGIRRYDDVLAADQKTFKELQELYSKPKKTIPLDLTLTLFENGEAVLKATNGEVSVCAKTDTAFKAENIVCDENSALKNLSKMGDSPYYLRNLKVENPFSMALPISQLNLLRREALEKVSLIRQKVEKIPFSDCFENKLTFKKRERKSPSFFVRIEDVSQLPFEKLSEISRVILPLEKVTKSDVELLGEKLVPELARVKFSTEHAVLNKLKEVKEFGITEALISNIGDILLCKEAGIEPISNFGLNITNSLSLCAYKDLGVKSFVVSPELSFAKIKALSSDFNIGVFGYGFLPLMVTRNCPAKNTLSCEKCKGKARFLTDRRNVKFEVKCRGGYSEILNSSPIYLADKFVDLETLDFVMLYFTSEDKKSVCGVLDDYLKRHSKRENITRGLYYRGSI